MKYCFNHTWILTLREKHIFGTFFAVFIILESEYEI